MIICENCSCTNEGTYGSGRFCSVLCARGFSTQNKRSEINKKVSDTLAGRGVGNISLVCETCEKTFVVPFGKRKQKTCSRNCGRMMAVKNPEYIKKMSEIRTNAILSGIVNGNGIKCIFEFNNYQIKCDSKLEYACLMFFTINQTVLNIKRADVRIEYQTDGITHTYIPDFIIETDKCTYIVECKSTKLGTDLREKWQTYIRLSDVKKKLLKEYAKNNNLIDFWFTEKTYKGYKNLKLI
jgi:hypothetical protein